MDQEKAWCLWYFAYILDMFWIYKIWFYFVQVGLTRRQVAGLFLVLRRSQDLLQESEQNEKQRLHKDKKWFGDDPADIKIQLQMQILLERNLFHLFNIFHPKSASTLWQWVSYQKRDQIYQMSERSRHWLTEEKRLNSKEAWLGPLIWPTVNFLNTKSAS